MALGVRVRDTCDLHDGQSRTGASCACSQRICGAALMVVWRFGSSCVCVFCLRRRRRRLLLSRRISQVDDIERQSRLVARGGFKLVLATHCIVK